MGRDVYDLRKYTHLSVAGQHCSSPMGLTFAQCEYRVVLGLICLFFSELGAGGKKSAVSGLSKSVLSSQS